MKTKVINIDYIGVQGLQDLIENNPDWMLITCGSSTTDMKINGVEKVVNFAVFEQVIEDVEFKQ